MKAISNRDCADIIVILNEVRKFKRESPKTGAEYRIYNTLSRARQIAARLEKKLKVAV